MDNFLKTSHHRYSINIKNVVLRAYQYDTSLYSDQKFRELGIPFPHTLRKAAIKRKAEYLAGRFAAKEALKSTGFAVDGIGIGYNRAPIWPEGVVASITHTDKIALSISACNKQLKYLGVDLEDILTISTANILRKIVIDQHEQKLLRQTPAEFSTLVTLAFSAKESIFKALHPYVKRYFDFSAAKIHRISLSNQEIEFILAEDLCPLFPKNTTIIGRFHITSDNILSIIYKEA